MLKEKDLECCLMIRYANPFQGSFSHFFRYCICGTLAYFMHLGNKTFGASLWILILGKSWSRNHLQTN